MVEVITVGAATRQGAEEFLAEVATWLQTQTEPARPVRWRFRGGKPVEVRGLAHLSQLVLALNATADWAVVERPGGVPWAQTMRVAGGWITEVDGGEDQDSYARRVIRAGVVKPGELFEVVSCNDAGGKGGALYLVPEILATPTEVARMLWSWVHGRLPGEYELRELNEYLD